MKKKIWIFVLLNLDPVNSVVGQNILVRHSLTVEQVVVTCHV